MPALGYKIHTANPTADMKINLVGVALGDALIDPQNVNQSTLWYACTVSIDNILCC